jgi:hypothetical protein
MSIIESRSFTVGMDEDSPWSVNLTIIDPHSICISLHWNHKYIPTHRRVLEGEEALKLLRFFNAKAD